MATPISLEKYDIHVANVVRNAAPAVLYEDAIRTDPTAAIAGSGALMITSGEKTGRSPKDKRIADNPQSTNNIWWGPINMQIDEHTFEINRERAIDYLNTRGCLYVVDVERVLVDQP